MFVTLRDDDRIVAVGMLTQENLRMLGGSLKKVIPISEDDQFADLIAAFYRAEERLKR